MSNTLFLFASVVSNGVDLIAQQNLPLTQIAGISTVSNTTNSLRTNLDVLSGQIRTQQSNDILFFFIIEIYIHNKHLMWSYYVRRRHIHTCKPSC